MKNEDRPDALRRMSQRWYDLGAFVPAFLALVVVVTVFVFADTQRSRLFHEEEKERATERLAVLSAQIQTNITGNVKLLQGLVAGIGTEPQIQQERFFQLGEQIFRARSQLLGVAAAPNLTVKLLYPRVVGQDTIGLDYRKNEELRKSVYQAREIHDSVLAGPMKTASGSLVLMARCPVYVTRGKSQSFWGIVSGTIDLNRLFGDSGVEGSDLDLSISLQKTPLQQSEVFVGSLEIVNDEPVRISVDLGYDTWHLAARPRGGWSHNPPMIFFRFCMILVSACVVVPLVWVGFLLRSRQRTILALQSREDELENARAMVEHQSLHDALTGLPNRRYLDKLIGSHRPTEEAGRYAFIHVDLDRFKDVNDTLGHAAGDEVLRLSAARQRSLLDPSEFVARIGGDEFVVVLRGSAPEQRANALARQIVDAHDEIFEICGNECRIGASAGIAWQAGVEDDLNQLLINADISLYEAKNTGRGRVGVYSEGLRLATLRRKQSEDEVLAALEHNQFIPFFQPQIDAQTLEVVGVEALARWDHREHGLLAPARFLNIFESLHRAAELDAIILESAIFQTKRWAANGINVPRLSVNISSQRLKDPHLLDKLAGMYFEKGKLAFELLESISFDDSGPGHFEIIKNIKKIGIEVEIDDFGTGHASIVSLLELAPSRLKIDRKLVGPIVNSISQRKLLSSIIDMARSLNIEVVAEGVETSQHIKVLRELGCHVLQGYAIAKPMSSDEFISFMKAGNPLPATDNETSMQKCLMR
jgi:diguanylate cyclase (GGDEF)-like protein